MMDMRGRRKTNAPAVLVSRAGSARARATCRSPPSPCNQNPTSPLPTVTDLADRPTVNGQVTTPCQRCAASDLECVIGGSNRGGRRVRRKTIPHQDTSQLERSSEHDLESSLSQGPSSGGAADVTAQGIDMPSMMDTGPGRESVIPLDPALRPANRVSGLDASRESSTGAGNIAFNDLQNPSDALGIL